VVATVAGVDGPFLFGALVFVLAAIVVALRTSETATPETVSGTPTDAGQAGAAEGGAERSAPPLASVGSRASDSTPD
jgi:hypothetical protein